MNTGSDQRVEPSTASPDPSSDPAAPGGGHPDGGDRRAGRTGLAGIAGAGGVVGTDGAWSIPEILGTEVIVATADDGWSVPLLHVADTTTLPVFVSEADLPPRLPPRCAEWQRVFLHEIVAAVHTDQIYIHPTGELLPMAELRRPAEALVEAARRWHRGSGDQETLLARFAETSVYCEAGDRPGTPAFRAEGSLVPIFTTLERFVRAMGNVGWFSATGAELLKLVPPGLDLVLDPGTPHSCPLPRD